MGRGGGGTKSIEKIPLSLLSKNIGRNCSSKEGDIDVILNLSCVSFVFEVDLPDTAAT